MIRSYSLAYLICIVDPPMFNRLTTGLQVEEAMMSTLKWNCSDPEGSKDSKRGSAVSEEQGLEFRTYHQRLSYSVSITSVVNVETECATLSAVTVSYFFKSLSCIIDIILLGIFKTVNWSQSYQPCKLEQGQLYLVQDCKQWQLSRTIS